MAGTEVELKNVAAEEHNSSSKALDDIPHLPYSPTGDSPMDSVAVPIPNEDIPVDKIVVPGEVIIAQEAFEAKKGAHPYLSKIYRGGFHTSRLAPIKDLIVPTGPLSSFTATVFNLANSTIGAGILGMGSAFRETGLIFGSILLSIVPLLGGLSTYLLLLATAKTESRSMVTCAFKCYKKPGSIFVDVITMISNFGTLVAYFVLLGDFIPTVAHALISPTSLLAQERLLAMALAALFLLPLVMRPNLNSLRTMSLLSMVFVLFVITVIVVNVSTKLSNSGAEGTTLFKIDLDSFISIPVICFAFNNITVVLPIYIEMANPVISNFMKVLLWSSSFCFIMYEVAGVFSYLAFGSELDGNMLNNFDLYAPEMVLARAAFSFTIISTFPLVLFPLRLSIEHLIFGTRRQFDMSEFAICTLVIVASTYGVAAITDDVELIFGITGSLGSALLMFVIPGLLYIKAIGRSQSTLLLVSAVILIIIGIAIAILGIIGFSKQIAG